MARRTKKRYTLNETLYIAGLYDANLTEDEIEKLTGRSRAGLRKKFEVPRKSDASTSCRSIKQYSSLKELYEHFGEEYPDTQGEVDADVIDRIDAFITDMQKKKKRE